MTRCLLALLGLSFALVLPRAAAACAACSSGDSTLAALGTEQPFEGRLRSAAELRYRSDAIGTRGADLTSVRELRADLSLAWSPRQDLTLLADVPWLYRRVTDASLARNESLGLGELELSARWFVWRDRDFAPRWLASVLGGVKLPTAPRLEAVPGQALPLEAQPGTGSFDTTLGTSLAWVAAVLSAQASLSWREPLWFREAFQPGRSVRASLALQTRLLPPLALRALSELRVDAVSREQRAAEPNSGGSLAFGGLELAWSPQQDDLILANVRVPVLQRLHGAHVEGPSVGLAFLRDW